jgi:hypothetical protein
MVNPTPTTFTQAPYSCAPHPTASGGGNVCTQLQDLSSSQPSCYLGGLVRAVRVPHTTSLCHCRLVALRAGGVGRGPSDHGLCLGQDDTNLSHTWFTAAKAQNGAQIHKCQQRSCMTSSSSWDFPQLIQSARTGIPPSRALPTMTVRAQPARYSVKEPLSKKPDSHSPCYDAWDKRGPTNTAYRLYDALFKLTN